MTESKTQHRIVVGIDGSAASKSALAWAVEEARARAASVVAVHAWDVPALGLGAIGGAALPLVTIEDLEKLAHDTARDTVAEVLGDDLSVPVVTTIRRGHPAVALVDEAKDADLLVVGSEGHGAIAGMLLGSVSMYVVHRAACPVTVVRPGWTPST